MKQRRVDETVQLVPYYPNYRTALVWYQDLELCKQVDNRDEVYDLDCSNECTVIWMRTVICFISNIKTDYAGMCACSPAAR